MVKEFWSPRSSPNVRENGVMCFLSTGYIEWRILTSELSNSSCDPNDDAESIPFALR